MRNVVCAAIIGLTLSGCSLLGVRGTCEPTRMWTKEGATDADFFQAKFVCIQQAQFNAPDSPVGLNWESFNECMKALGYSPLAVE